MKNWKIILILVSTLILWMANSYAETASWYGGGEKLNEYTASGERFDPSKLACASWYYDFGQMLRVTNIETGKSIVVICNDRGPNKRLGRAIDLSREAFRKLAPLEKGLIRVKIEGVE